MVIAIAKMLGIPLYDENRDVIVFDSKDAAINYVENVLNNNKYNFDYWTLGSRVEDY